MATPSTSPNGNNSPSPAEPMDEAFWKQRRLMGAIAGLLWLLVFSGGILIDAEDSRVALGWKRQDVATQAEVGRVTQLLVGTKVGDPQATAALKEAIQPSEASKAQTKRQEQVEGRWRIHNFICGMLFFTPINVALLAILAGFIGGCLSSEADVKWIKQDISEAKQANDHARLALLRRREHYLTEHPFYSTVRSFIIYLIFISGLYVFASDPFNPSSQSQGFTQYMRLAGMVSLLGFVVGYDPTKFQEWLALVPSPARSKKDAENDDQLQVNLGIPKMDDDKNDKLHVNFGIPKKDDEKEDEKEDERPILGQEKTDVDITVTQTKLGPESNSLESEPAPSEQKSSLPKLEIKPTAKAKGGVTAEKLANGKG